MPCESLRAERQVEVRQVEFFLDAFKRVRLDLAVANLVHDFTEQFLHQYEYIPQTTFSISQTGEVSAVTWPKRLKPNSWKKIAKPVLCHRLGDLGVTHTVYLWLVGKRVVDFLLVLIELFSLVLTAEAL